MANGLWKINDCVLDTQLGQISREGQTIRLEQKVLKALNYFIERSGEVVTKEELIEAVWGYDQVTDQSIARVISQLRKALGDNKENPRYIETRPKAGYRFIAKVAGHEEKTASKPKGMTGWKVALVLVVILGILVVIFSPASQSEEGKAIVSQAKELLGKPSSENTVRAVDLLKHSETEQLAEKHITMAFIYGYKHGDFLGVDRNQRSSAYEFHFNKARELGASESSLNLVETARTYYFDRDPERAYLLLQETGFEEADIALGNHLYALIQANRGHFNEALSRMDVALDAGTNQDMMWDHAWLYYLAGEQNLALDRIAAAEKAYGESAGWTKMLVLHAMDRDLEAAEQWLQRNEKTRNYTPDELDKMRQLIEQEDSPSFYNYLIEINEVENSGRFEDPEAMAIWAITAGDETAGANYLGESLAIGYRFYTRWFSRMPVFKSLDLSSLGL